VLCKIWFHVIDIAVLQGYDVDEVAAKGCAERPQSAEEEGRCADCQISYNLEENYRGLTIDKLV